MSDSNDCKLTGEVVAEYWFRDGQIVVEAPKRQSTAEDAAIRLIRKAVELAVAAEREACANLADVISRSYADVDGDRIYRNGYRFAAEKVAQLIRARGKS